ncbi:hypothetical protein ABKA04_003533 [Annulohypoxylon sp. FPYF3050]
MICEVDISKETRVFDPNPFLSNRVKRYAPGAIRRLLPLENLPGMISLVAGSNDEIVLSEEALIDGLQYGLPGGNPDLVEWFKGFQTELHGIERNQTWACCVGNGSQELLHRTFQVLTDPGDPVLIETPAYPGVVGFLQAEGHMLVQANTDRHGLDPCELERTLLQWPKNRPCPKVLYTVPTGSNPTGRSCPEWRKVEILRLAKQFNFMILEDDAYFFLNFDDEPNGPLTIVNNVVKLTENINLQPSSTSQIIALSLFRHWGHAGFLEHCARASDFYRQKRNVFAAAIEEHLKYRATWDIATAGLFFWITLRLPPGEDTFELLSKKGMEYGLLAIPGVAFMPDNCKTCQLRASFSLVTEEQANEACRRLAQLVDDSWRDWVQGTVPGHIMDRNGLSNSAMTSLI